MKQIKKCGPKTTFVTLCQDTSLFHCLLIRKLVFYDRGFLVSLQGDKKACFPMITTHYFNNTKNKAGHFSFFIRADISFHLKM